MSEQFLFSYLNNIEASKLMEAFRLYGTREGRYTTCNLWLVFALTDMHKNFYLTRAYYHSTTMRNNTPDTVEYVLSCDEKLALVRCTIQRMSKNLCILSIHGENPFAQQQLVEMIIFYEENERKFIFEHKHKRITWQSLNVVRKRRLMMQNRENWTFDLLAKEYSFQILNRTQQSMLWDCICKYGDNFKNHGDTELGYALTDAQHSFWLTFCFYMSDGIKHCNEPDDYEYAIITSETAGVVRVWFQSDVQIKKIKGEIPFAEQKLCEVVEFYRRFHRDWERVHTKMYGSIPKNVL